MMAENDGLPIVLITGVGTLGSPLAELLARQQPDSTLILVDPGVVREYHARKSTYRHSDIGQRKAIAEAQHLRDIAPHMWVVPVARPLEALGAGPFRVAAVAIAALDNRMAKFAWSRACQAAAVPHALIAELEGGDSFAGRLRAFAPARTAGRGPCLECGWSAQDYAVLGRLSQPCNLPQEATAGEKSGPPTPVRFSSALRLAAECVEEIGRGLAGRPSWAPGEELRLLPEQRRYAVFRTPPRADCLCPHGAAQPRVDLTGAVQELCVGDFIGQADAALGRGWIWHAADGAGRQASDLAPQARRLLADLCPPGDLLRMTRASGETVWVALPTDGLLAWLSEPSVVESSP